MSRRNKPTYIHICLTLSMPFLLFCFLFTAHFVNTTEIKLRSKNCVELRADSSKNFSPSWKENMKSNRERDSRITGTPLVNGIESSSTELQILKRSRKWENIFGKFQRLYNVVLSITYISTIKICFQTG